jgi:hypothetical protein
MAHLKITRRNVGFRYGTQPALLGLGVSSHDCIADGFPGVKVLYVVFGSRVPPNLVAQGHAVQERKNVYGGAHVVARPMRDLTDPAYVFALRRVKNIRQTDPCAARRTIQNP